MVLSMKGAGASADRDRLFGYWVCGQLVVRALALALLPSLFARLGLGAFFAVLALAMAALLPLAPGFATAETREDQPAARASGAGNGILFPAVAMAGVMGFYVGLGGCWAYAALIAGQAGLDAQAVANRLAMASLVESRGRDARRDWADAWCAGGPFWSAMGCLSSRSCSCSGSRRWRVSLWPPDCSSSGGLSPCRSSFRQSRTATGPDR
jgi:hypothetical protein